MARKGVQESAAWALRLFVRFLSVAHSGRGRRPGVDGTDAGALEELPGFRPNEEDLLRLLARGDEVDDGWKLALERLLPPERGPPDLARTPPRTATSWQSAAVEARASRRARVRDFGRVRPTPALPAQTDSATKPTGEAERSGPLDRGGPPPGSSMKGCRQDSARGLHMEPSGEGVPWECDTGQDVPGPGPTGGQGDAYRA